MVPDVAQGARCSGAAGLLFRFRIGGVFGVEPAYGVHGFPRGCRAAEEHPLEGHAEFRRPPQLERRVLTFSLSALSKLAGLPQMKLAWIVARGLGPSAKIPSAHSSLAGQAFRALSQHRACGRFRENVAHSGPVGLPAGDSGNKRRRRGGHPAGPSSGEGQGRKAIPKVGLLLDL